MKHILLVVALAFVGATALGQTNLSVGWFTIAGGGGTSTGGVYAISGTIGQHDAGKLSGGNYTLHGGFRVVVAAVQMPGAPLLTITRSGANVIVSWPSSSAGFVLQQTGNIADPNGWSNFGGPVDDNGTVKSATISLPTGKKFYRLKR